MAFILNIDTATEVCSVSLSENGKVITIKEIEEEKAHASKLTLLIDQVFRETGLTGGKLNAVAVSKGPGSYTGLRIGVSTAKGICYGLGIPLIAVNTLNAMASGYKEISDLTGTKTLFCPMIDARRMEVFTAIFDSNLNEMENTKALIVSEGSFNQYLPEFTMIFFGSGAEKCKPVLKHKNAVFGEYKHSSAYLTALANEAYYKSDFENVAYFEPFYLKDFVATIPKRNLFHE
ncbi:MAG: tRNA (adenosine(37)-N6)-threonylcarbamoyltransferase complex dimerization subunit type 1 TsaB [Bacteroidales bacterium]|nr:tRNA (adenosine(37)-N6)-threonylcarbamoyltransferase complex dimerization subunit type 1 TsaB [Bacteroidales bacterium]